MVDVSVSHGRFGWEDGPALFAYGAYELDEDWDEDDLDDEDEWDEDEWDEEWKDDDWEDETLASPRVHVPRSGTRKSPRHRP